MNEDQIQEYMAFIEEVEELHAELNTLKGTTSRLEDENEYLRGLVDKLSESRPESL